MDKRDVFILLLALGILLLAAVSTVAWVFSPTSAGSSRKIAMGLLEFRSMGATNHWGAIGAKEYPTSLALYGNLNPSFEADTNDVQVTCYFDRFGVYSERTYTIRQDHPGGVTWTLASHTRTYLPWRGWVYWSERLITVTNEM